jgi:hypothetical protein
MTGDGGKDLKTDGLGLIAKGLTEALGELKELGMVGTAGAGRGFGDIALSGLELGHEGLTGEFKSFCERWEWGVRSLINEGNGFAVRTGLAAGTYDETEQYVEGSFKIVTNAAIGNPYASEDEVTRQGWGDIATSGAFGGGRDTYGQGSRGTGAEPSQDVLQRVSRPLADRREALRPAYHGGTGSQQYCHEGVTLPAPAPRIGQRGQPAGQRTRRAVLTGGRLDQTDGGRLVAHRSSVTRRGLGKVTSATELRCVWLRIHPPSSRCCDLRTHKVPGTLQSPWGQERLDAFCGFLRRIGRRLGKPVLMNPEGDCGHPVLGFDVETDRVVLLAEPPVR